MTAAEVRTQPAAPASPGRGAGRPPGLAAPAQPARPGRAARAGRLRRRAARRAALALDVHQRLPRSAVPDDHRGRRGGGAGDDDAQPVRRAGARHRPLAAVPAAGHGTGDDRRGDRRTPARRHRCEPERRRPQLARNVIGITGIGLLASLVTGGLLAWILPMAYVAFAEYALLEAWRSPWTWPVRPPADRGAWICAAAVFAARPGLHHPRRPHPPQRRRIADDTAPRAVRARIRRRRAPSTPSSRHSATGGAPRSHDCER